MCSLSSAFNGKSAHIQHDLIEISEGETYFSAAEVFPVKKVVCLKKDFFSKVTLTTVFTFGQ